MSDGHRDRAWLALERFYLPKTWTYSGWPFAPSLG
jgi:hypothetical protein